VPKDSLADTLVRTPRRPPSTDAVQRYYEWVRDAILSGRLGAGDEINSVHLSGELGFSRGPLREALRLLEQEGFVDTQYNRRARVAALSVDDLEQVYALRMSVEPMAARLSVPKLSREDIGHIQDRFSEMDEAARQRDVGRFEGPHRSFHRLILSHAGDRIVATFDQLWVHSERYRHFRITEEMPVITANHRLVEHRAILKACRRREADDVARLLCGHLLNTFVGVISRVAPGRDQTTIRALAESEMRRF
jgi:DNA-binding GntR family transcriptional regulator